MTRELLFEGTYRVYQCDNCSYVLKEYDKNIKQFCRGCGICFKNLGGIK